MSRRPPPDARPEKGVAPGARRCRCRGRPAAPRRGFRRRRRRSRRRRAEGPATRHEGRGVGPQRGEGRPHRRPGTRVPQASVRWQQQARVRPPTARGRRVEARGGKTRPLARARWQQRARRQRAALAQGRKEVTRRGRPRRERECRWTPGAPAADPATRRVEPVTGHRAGRVVSMVRGKGGGASVPLLDLSLVCPHETTSSPPSPSVTSPPSSALPPRVHSRIVSLYLACILPVGPCRFSRPHTLATPSESLPCSSPVNTPSTPPFPSSLPCTPSFNPPPNPPSSAFTPSRLSLLPPPSLFLPLSSLPRVCSARVCNNRVCACARRARVCGIECVKCACVCV